MAERGVNKVIPVQMELTTDEKAILEGKHGDTLRKVMEAVVLYGQVFGAKRLVPLAGAVHLVTSFWDSAAQTGLCHDG